MTEQISVYFKKMQCLKYDSGARGWDASRDSHTMNAECLEALMDLDLLTQAEWLCRRLPLFLMVKSEGKMEQKDWKCSVGGTLLPRD